MDKKSVYSFALKPEEHMPSGVVNLSRLYAPRNYVIHERTYPQNSDIYKIEEEKYYNHTKKTINTKKTITYKDNKIVSEIINEPTTHIVN